MSTAENECVNALLFQRGEVFTQNLLDDLISLFETSFFNERNEKRTRKAYNLCVGIKAVYRLFVCAAVDRCVGGNYTDFFIFCQLCRFLSRRSNNAVNRDIAVVFFDRISCCRICRVAGDNYCFDIKSAEEFYIAENVFGYLFL